MDCSMTCFPVLHYLPQFAQTHIHWVSDAIQPSHPLLPPSLLVLNLSQHRLFAKESVLCLRWPKYWSFSSSISLPMNIQGWFPLGLTGFLSPWGPRDSEVFSSTTVWKHQFFGAQSSLWSNSHIHTWLLEKTVTLAIQTFVDKVVSLLFNMLSRFVIAFLPRSKHLWN